MPPKKKKIAPQLLGPVGSGAPAATVFAAPTANAPTAKNKKKKKKKKKKQTTGYKRLEHAVGGTVKEMKTAIHEHNRRYCIKLSGSKSALNTRVKDTARKLSTISRSGGGGGGKKGSGSATEGQKKTAKALGKVAQAYGNLKEDANPELSF